MKKTACRAFLLTLWYAATVTALFVGIEIFVREWRLATVMLVASLMAAGSLMSLDELTK